MHLADFDYELPPALIARYPPPRRCDSRLLVVDARNGQLSDRRFDEFPACLRRGDLLVMNDTRVIKARLRGQKESGGAVEILVERLLAPARALAQVRASKSPKPGSTIQLAGEASATIAGREGDFFELEFSTAIAPLLERAGEVPLPPYLGRDAESADDERYQTVFARRPGAVAAPTAGLHFDERMLEEIAEAGVRLAFVTLHVGAGTFQPLRAERVADNRLHAEQVIVEQSTCDAARETRAAGGRVVAVGTTAVRALESASASGRIEPFDGESELFIVPGYRFRCVDRLLTNFHLPRSSLLMLVAAFAGRQRILDAYRHAVAAEYRFFSYGDAMLVIPGERAGDGSPA